MVSLLLTGPVTRCGRLVFGGPRRVQSVLVGDSAGDPTGGAKAPRRIEYIEAKSVRDRARWQSGASGTMICSVTALASVGTGNECVGLPDSPSPRGLCNDLDEAVRIGTSRNKSR